MALAERTIHQYTAVKILKLLIQGEGYLKWKITIAGTGYVGLSNAVILAQHNEVIAMDIIKEKVDMINNKKSPIDDAEIEEYLATKDLNLQSNHW